jgi:hypothetical protein
VRLEKLAKGDLYTSMGTMLRIQHALNPLHVYCRLIEKGLNKSVCISVCKFYEVVIYSWLAWFTLVGVHILKSVKPASYFKHGGH